MKDYRQLILAFIIAILFSVFVFSLVDAIYPAPDWSDCEYPRVKDPTVIDSAPLNTTEYDNCWKAHEAVREQYQFVKFLISIIVGVIALLIGMYVQISTPVGMAVASGLLLGGLFTIFFGTMSSWSGIGRVLRPLVVFVELIIVIWVAYKKLNGSVKSKKRK